ncbi:MAG: ABC transporter ATP-binding protein/permease [Alphaproteobacteria bacterium]|jgi:ATP-binding cassette subfamily B protein|nr:ABC transporter ATP-binding protein/permease [Alphaproteobacteria bacterium]
MDNKEFPHSVLKFIIHFLRPYSRHFFGIIFISILWAAIRTIEPYIMKVVLDILEKSSTQYENLFYQLKTPMIIFILIRVFMNFMSRFHDYLWLKMMPNFNKNIVMRMTKYVQKHSLAYFQHHFGGSLISKISMIADTSETILNEFVYEFIFPLFSICIITVTMGFVSPKFALILIIWACIFVGISFFLSLRVQILSKELSEKSTTLIGKLIDSITNILAVRLFARRNYEIKVLESVAQEKVKKAEELGWNDLKRNAVMDIMSNFLIVILIYYLIVERQKGNISLGDFALILTLSLSVLDIVWEITHHYLKFVENFGKCSQALNTIVVPHAIKNNPTARPLIVKKGSIEFRDVSFTSDKGNPILRNINLKIAGKEKVGIVGQSGSGKTTLLNLLVRLMDVNNGYILVDGQDVKSVTQESLHQNITFIPQDPMLFHRTILENIQYGNLHASEEAIKDAARKSFAEGFINSFPKGFQTLVGERGSILSGGQRQRLAIARSILKNSKILLLDEATSALDSETEHYIQESLKDLMKDKTVLVVAHRLSTLQQMDRIIVLNNGMIVEEGTHRSLLIKGGYYAKFWHLQHARNST